MTQPTRPSRWIPLALYPALLFAMNLAIVWRLFRVSYTSYLESNEGSFIAIARQVAEHPWHYIVDRGWWPLWSMGFPFAFSYLPGLQIIVGLYSRWSGVSPGLAFHQVCGLCYALLPVTLYAMAYGLTRRTHASFASAALFSLISPCAFLVPGIGRDIGGVWNLRRLNILAYYGEGPHTASIAMMPLAALFLYWAITRRTYWSCVLAGVFAGLTVILNAFGAVLVILVCIALLLTIETSRVVRNMLMLGTIGALAYLWISPLLPPAVIAAIRVNSPTVGGDFAFSQKSLFGCVIIGFASVVVWFLTRRWTQEIRFFLLCSTMLTGIVILAHAFDIFVVPQPHRYQIAMDLGLCLSVVFAGEKLLGPLLRRVQPPIFLPAAVAALVIFGVLQLRSDMRYARGLIRFADVTQSVPYHMAQWANANMPGQRMMISGAWGFHFNAFSDNPQLYGGHDPMQPNFTMRVVTFTIYTGVNAGDRDAEYSILWMKAMGTRAVSVPRAGSPEPYKPIVHADKFEGVLPVLWSEGPDVLYSVPVRSNSLAHVVPGESVVAHVPIHGLDIAEIQKYVAALEDPAYPEAPFAWRGLNDAEIRARVAPGQALSVQVSYDPGWEASVNDEPLAIQKDGLGMMTLHPQCQGTCTVQLHYAGSREQHIAGFGSIALMLGVAGAGLFKAVRASRDRRDL